MSNFAAFLAYMWLAIAGVIALVLGVLGYGIFGAIPGVVLLVAAGFMLGSEV